MRKNALIISCVTCVFGAFGAFFRWLMDMTAFEADTGLYIAGGVWSRALVVACLGCAAALLAMVLKLKIKDGLALPEEYSAALGGTTALYKPLYLVISAIMAAGGALLMFSMGKDAYPAFQFILAVLGILSAVGFLLMASAAVRKREPPLNCFGATLIIVMFCFWLIVSYRENANSPIVWAYGMELLALSCSLGAFYFIAGVPFGRPRPFASIYFGQLAIFLCIVTLPDKRWLGQRLMLVAAIGMLLFLTWMMISNLRAPAPAGERETGEAEE